MKNEIHIAQIEGVASEGNLRLQVRIMPHMQNLEKDYLPIWPFFFKHQALTGKQGDYVWVICNEEFTTGYVLGYAADFTWHGNYEPSSIPEDTFEKIADAYLNVRGFLISFSNIIVTHWTEETIHFIDKEKGTAFVAFTNGTFHMIRSNEVFVTVKGKSTLLITEKEIALEAEKIRLASDQVTLGNNPTGYVMVNPGRLGKTALPSKSVEA